MSSSDSGCLEWQLQMLRSLNQLCITYGGLLRILAANNCSWTAPSLSNGGDNLFWSKYCSVLLLTVSASEGESLTCQLFAAADSWLKEIHRESWRRNCVQKKKIPSGIQLNINVQQWKWIYHVSGKKVSTTESMQFTRMFLRQTLKLSGKTSQILQQVQ